MATVNRETTLAALFDGCELGAAAEKIISSLAYEMTAAELLDWAVRNEFIVDPDDDEGDGETMFIYRWAEEGDEDEEQVPDFELGAEEQPDPELAFAQGDKVLVQQGDGRWVPATVMGVDNQDRDLPYYAQVSGGDSATWYGADKVRARQS